jgi:hypothetical protein
MISVVINTACLGSKAAETLGSAGHPHAERASFLRQAILPRMLPLFDQVIVAGEFEPGKGYEYIHSPSRYFDCRDVLAQRQAGFAAARHDMILFQMDDHLVDEALAQHLRTEASSWDVLSPARHSLRDGRALNSGWNDPREEYRQQPYLHTHVIVMKRQAVVQCPWSGLPPIRHFDVMHTKWFHDAKLTIRIARELVVYDLEE